MINFEEEISKFHPSLEVTEVEENILHNQDFTDVADIFIRIIKNDKDN